MPQARKKSKSKAIPRRPAPQRKPAPTQAIVKAQPPTVSEAIEQVLLSGNLVNLTVEQRLDYYKKVCQSLGLNPLTRPFEYISFEGRLQLYARKDCTEQLRKIHGIAIVESKADHEDGLYVVHVKAQDKHGRTDTGTGVVDLGKLTGKDRANAIMKAETKAKRRATLSLAGLGFLDESELDTVAEYGTLTPGGRIMTPVQPQLSPSEENWKAREAEGISKLTPDQQKVVKSKMADATIDRPTDCLFYVHVKESDTYTIDGAQSLKEAHRDLLRDLWSMTVGAIVANPQQLGKLISQFEQRKVRFIEWPPPKREPGE
jgi:hypothetical protein